jgi:hypothetical protein
LREAKWYQFVLRFLLGGSICVLAGVIAEKYGPGVGGLFLAFPAIFPASATLLEGAAIGNLGMMAFAAIVSIWRLRSLFVHWRRHKSVSDPGDIAR